MLVREGADRPVMFATMAEFFAARRDGDHKIAGCGKKRAAGRMGAPLP